MTDFRGQLTAFAKCVCQGARLMVGFPDYDAYAAHASARRSHDLPGIFPRKTECALWRGWAEGVSMLLSLTGFESAPRPD